MRHNQLDGFEMTQSDEGLQHVSVLMRRASRELTQKEIDDYLTSGRCVNDPPPRTPKQVLRVREAGDLDRKP